MDPLATMHFWPDDVFALTRQFPYVRLSKPEPGRRFFLQSLVSTGEDMAADLPNFPAQAFEELDMHYRCAGAAALVEPDLLEDLIATGWQGANVAAFLAALRPDRADVAPFEAWPADAPGGWLARIAVAEIRGHICDGLDEEQLLLRSLAGQIEAIKPPAVQLRKMPDADGLAELERQRAAVREAYARGGADAALEKLNQSDGLKQLKS